MNNRFKTYKQQYLTDVISIAPLITFRILFGAILLLGTIRFVYNGWVETLYLQPRFFFNFFGFEWVQPFGKMGMYALLAVITISAAMVMLGFFYRIAIITFFLSFTYLELIDATNYLNHYYLVILLAFLMIFLPANQQFSIDSWRKPSIKVSHVPAWMISILIFQISLVYICAGLAKCNSDWLFNAMPLAVWLPEHQDLPLIGNLLKYKATAYLFSWGGAFYDLTIVGFLLYNRTRIGAYVAVVVFHLMTNLLFNIGLFPVIMISSTLLFFPADFHQKILVCLKVLIGRLLNFKSLVNATPFSIATPRFNWKPLLTFFIILQLVIPFRHLFYPGNTMWTEEAYRFSWRVMLVEKIGQTTFRIEDPDQGRKTEVINGRYLTQFQEKQMSIQPDFILQFAHFLKKEYQIRHAINNPIITVDAFVALNGRTSQRLIDPTINLAEIDDGFKPKDWILPFED